MTRIWRELETKIYKKESCYYTNNILMIYLYLLLKIVWEWYLQCFIMTVRDASDK